MWLRQGLTVGVCNTIRIWLKSVVRAVVIQIMRQLKRRKKNETFDWKNIGEITDNNKNKISQRRKWKRKAGNYYKQNVSPEVTNKQLYVKSTVPSKKMKAFWKYQPKNPPPVWEGIPWSQASNKPLAIRKSKTAYSSFMTKLEHELVLYVEKGKAAFKVIHDGLVNNASERFVI